MASALATVALTGSRTVFDERGHPYTQYELHVTSTTGQTRSVERRFQEFKELSQSLLERHKTAGDSVVAPPELPRSILSAGWFGQTTNPEFVRRREKGLHGWLQALCASLPADDMLLVGMLSPANAQRRTVGSPSSSACASPRAKPAPPSNYSPFAVPWAARARASPPRL